MKKVRIVLTLLLTMFVLGISVNEFRKHTDLKPQIELVADKDWSLTSDQNREIEKLNQAFSSNLGFKGLVVEFANIFKDLSKLHFIEDSRWAWDHKYPLKIKAFVSKPKAMMFKDGDWFLVSEKGHILKRIKTNETLDLPIFRTEALLKDEDVRQKCFKILQAFESPNSAIPISAVSEISSDKRGIFFLLSEGFKVYMSDKNTDKQIARLSNVISYLKKEKINVEFIDSQTVQKILVRPKAKKD